MQIITDIPAIASGIYEGQSDWSESESFTPDSPLDRVWAALSGKRSAFTANVADFDNTEAPLVLVSEAGQSQFDQLVNLYRSNTPLPDGIAAHAVRGDGFHGRGSRSWAAHKGNVHLSMGFSPGVEGHDLGPGFTMLPAVAAMDVINEALEGQAHAQIKWVNDIEISRKKVSGVITSAIYRGKIVEHVVYGVGVNVAVAPDLLSTPFVPEIDCLNQVSGRHMDANVLLGRLVVAIRQRHAALIEEGPASLLADYIEASSIIEKPVRIWAEDADGVEYPEEVAPVRGVVQSIGPDLSLKLDSGEAPVRDGRLAYEDVCAQFRL